MGAFRDNEQDRNKNSNDNKSGGSGGFVYPDATGFENTGSSSGSSDNFEYGDDSVAGEYEVKESSVFKYGDGSVPDTIGAYYGNETRQDRYAKDSFNEGYGYETVPEVDYSEVINEQISEEFASGEAPSNEPVSEPQNIEFDSAAGNGGTDSQESYYSYDHESQADELDSARSYVEPHKYDTEDDPNISYDMPFIDEEERENMTLQPVSRFNSRLTGTIAVSVIALAGILGIGAFAVICDRRKTDANVVNSYEIPTTKEEVTSTSLEETPAATDTPTPIPTATPTPEPTATPVPTNTPTPKPQQIYWPVTKKATPTPTPTTTDENTGENGSGNEGGNTGEGGTGEGGSGNEGGNTGEGGSGSGSGEGGSGSEGGNTGEGGSGSGEGGSGGDNGGGSSSGDNGGSTNPPPPPPGPADDNKPAPNP